MKKILKISLTLSISVVYLLAFTSVSYAQVNFAIPNPSRFNSLEDIISAAASLIQPLLIITFGAMIIVGAFLILSSQGQEEKIENGKKTITAAIIGFAIAVLAPTLVTLVSDLIGIDAFDTI